MLTTEITSVYNHGPKPIHKLTVNEFIHKSVANNPAILHCLVYIILCSKISIAFMIITSSVCSCKFV